MALPMQIAQEWVALGEGAVGMRGSLRGADIGEYTEAVAGSWDAEFVQLEPGHLGAGIEFLAGDEFVLYRESWEQGLQTRGAVLPGKIALGIPDVRSADDRWWGKVLPEGWMPFARSTRELDLVSGRNEGLIVLAMNEALLFEHYHRLTGREPDLFLQEGTALAVDPGRLRRLAGKWDRVLGITAQRSGTGITVADLVDDLIQVLRGPVALDAGPNQRRAVVRRVLEEASRHHFMTCVPELSCALNISRRTIEYAFREHLDLSPRAYFALRRLHLCRDALIESDPAEETVTSVAMRFGFMELGRLAAYYRGFFGELPSDTLRKPPRRSISVLEPVMAGAILSA